MTVISIDIGTTKICAAAIDPESGAVIEVLSGSNRFEVGIHPGERVQDAEKIRRIAGRLCSQLVKKYSPVTCIGITGQMHGIVYLDAKGRAASLLYTWQDACGDLPFKEDGGTTYAEHLSNNSRYPMKSGFGLTTCFYHARNGRIPSEAVQFCTIQDYIAMHMTRRLRPLVHVTDAASFGFFDLSKNEFDRSAISSFSINGALLPEITEDYDIIGETKEGIPVCVAIGDSQASFLGAVHTAGNSLLVNIGTGSQISFIDDGTADFSASRLERRPFFEGDTLITGSSLCGGKAFALLEKFFREVIGLAGQNAPASLYPHMIRLLSAYPEISDPLVVTTAFSGTRENPGDRGRFENISFDNFTPVHMMHGFLEGMTRELLEMIQPVIPLQVLCQKQLVASGNGIRKNPLLREILSRRFGLPVRIPVHNEEAAYGAALFAMIGIRKFPDYAHAQGIIRYEQSEDTL